MRIGPVRRRWQGTMVIPALLALSCGSPSGAPQQSAVAQPEPAQGAASSGPDRECRVVWCRLGVLRPRQSTEMEFEIRNDTDRPWTFQKTVVPCACTVVGATFKVIPPGESGRVKVAYTPPGERADESRTVHVLFAEDYAPLVDLRFTAHVREVVDYAPRAVEFGRVRRGQPARATLTFESFAAGEMSPPDVKSADPWVRPAVRPGRAGDGVKQAWEVECTLVSDALPRGDHSTTLVIRPDGGKGAAISVPAHAFLVPVAEVVPPRLFVGRTKPGEAREVAVMVLINEPGVVIDPAGVTLADDAGGVVRIARCERTANGVSLRLIFSAPAAQQSFPPVRVRFGDERIPAVELPVVAEVTGQ